MNLRGVSAIRIPEGSVRSVTVGGRTIWQKPDTEPYTELAYIESTGEQHIDTGIAAKSGIEVYLDHEFVKIKSTASILCGAINEYAGKRIYVAHSKGILGYGNAYNTSFSPEVGIRYDMYAKLYAGEQTVVVNDTTIARRTMESEVDTRLTAYLFACNTGITSSFGTAKIYSCRILTDGVLVRDFVPCRRNSDGVVCMYDRVTKTFFENLGTGQFIAGEVENAS